MNGHSRWEGGRDRHNPAATSNQRAAEQLRHRNSSATSGTSKHADVTGRFNASSGGGG